MNFDPHTFFVVFMDFLFILLTAVLLTYLLLGGVNPVVLRDRFAKLTGAEAWVALLFASYLLGHLDRTGKARAMLLRERMAGADVVLGQKSTPRPQHARSDQRTESSQPVSLRLWLHVAAR